MPYAWAAARSVLSPPACVLVVSRRLLFGSYSGAQVYAFEQCRAYYGTFFGEPTTKFGLRPSAITDPETIRKLVAFFSWTAWAASAEPVRSWYATEAVTDA